MKFKDFYIPGKVQFSFEVFPPKTNKGVSLLLQSLQELKPFNPAFVSVTYGAMGTTRTLTSDLALKIQRELGITTAFHFTCVGTSKAEIKEYVEHLEKEGITLIVALRGDPPRGVKNFQRPKDGFLYANELVLYLKELNHMSIAVAGYPEGHVEAPDKKTDLINLKRKVDAGADIVMTQLFFDNSDYFDFVDRARNSGITVPIIPGIMPILNIKQIEKVSSLCGAKIPDELYKRLLECGDDADAMREIGIEHAIVQCQELIQKKVPGIHFYILNKDYSVRKILKSIT